MSGEKPNVQWDSLFASGDFAEVLRHKQRNVVAVHNVRRLPNGAVELWRVTERPGTPADSVRVGTCTADTVKAEVEKIRRRMESDGWKHV